MKENWSAAAGHFDKADNKKTNLEKKRETPKFVSNRNENAEENIGLTEGEKARLEVEALGFGARLSLEEEREKPWSRKTTIKWAMIYLDKDEAWVDRNFEFRTDGTIMVKGLLDLREANFIDVFPRGVTKVDGEFYCDTFESAEGVEFPKEVRGNFTLDGLISAKGLKLPEKIGGHLSLDSLKSIEGLELPEGKHGRLHVRSLTSAEKNELRIKYPNWTII